MAVPAVVTRATLAGKRYDDLPLAVGSEIANSTGTSRVSAPPSQIKHGAAQAQIMNLAQAVALLVENHDFLTHRFARTGAALEDHVAPPFIEAGSCISSPRFFLCENHYTSDANHAKRTPRCAALGA